MKLIIKKIFILFMSFLCVLNFYHYTYASTIINSTKKQISGLGEKMIYDVGITGDSYGGLLLDELTRIYNLSLDKYCVAGSTILENEKNIMECIHNPKYTYIVLSIGVNDHCAQTSPENFLHQITTFAEYAKMKNKHLILHTYMTYQAEPLYTLYCSCSTYDLILQHVSNNYDCVKYIDMHDAENPRFYKEDHIHYNNDFYKLLINRIFDTLYEIKN